MLASLIEFVDLFCLVWSWCSWLWLIICFAVYSLDLRLVYIIIVLFGGLIATHFTIVINIIFGYLRIFMLWFVCKLLVLVIVMFCFRLLGVIDVVRLFVYLIIVML